MKIKSLSSMTASEAYDAVRNNWITSLFEPLPSDAHRRSKHSPHQGGWGTYGANCPRTSFSGSEYCSYRQPIARAFTHDDGSVLVVLNTLQYSNMTTDHQWSLRSGLDVCVRSEPRLSMISVKGDPGTVRAAACQAIAEAQGLASNLLRAQLPSEWRDYNDSTWQIRHKLDEVAALDAKWSCITIEDAAAIGKVRAMLAEALARFERLAFVRFAKARKGGPGAPSYPNPRWLPEGSEERKLLETLRALEAV